MTSPGDEQNIVLRFSVKGSDVTVKQIKQVDKATEHLATTTTTAHKSSKQAWDRYSDATHASLSKVDKALGAAESAIGRMPAAAQAALSGMVAAFRRGTTSVVAANAAMGREAAAAFEANYVGTGVGGRGISGALAKAAQKFQGLGTLGKVGIGAGVVAGGAALAGAGALVAWGTGGMQGASDQVEARNRIDALYGPGAAAGLVPTGGSYDSRQKAARTMGLSNTDYLQTYGALSSQLLGAGLSKSAAGSQAQALVQGAVDMGSFTNLSNDDATTAIQAVLRGEYDSAERLGVMLNQSAVDVASQRMFGQKSSSLTPGQAVQARLQALQESAGWKQAKGDFTRSLPTSLENQRKVAAATAENTQQRMGELLNKLVEALLPLVDPLMRVLDWVISGLKPVIEALGTVLNVTVNAVSNAGNLQGGGWSGTAASQPGGPLRGGLLGYGIIGHSGPSLWDTIKDQFGSPLVGGGLASGGTVPGWSPGLDNVLVPLSGGEGVLTPETVAMLGGSGAINAMNLAGLRRRGAGYANGTGAAQAVAGMLATGQANRGYTQGIYLPGMAAGGGGQAAATVTGGTGVERWRAMATQALKLTGQYSESNVNALLNQMRHESSGDPNAVNDWDRNALNGTPSKGLMQVIQPTFESYALPGYNSNLLDPLSNMIASIRYTTATYGSLKGGWTDRGYQAYDSGGWLEPGVNPTVNATGKPEAVLTDDQWSDMKRLADRASGGVQVHIGAIHVGSGGGNLVNTITDDLADAIAARVKQAQDRRL